MEQCFLLRVFPQMVTPIEQCPAVSVIVVHWMNIGDTVECLASLSLVDYPGLNVIVVNNGSVDFDEAQVRQACPGVSIITSCENLGFAGGSNLGIKMAIEQEAAFILLLNNDTIVRPDLITALLPALGSQDVGIVGPVIAYYTAPAKVWFGGGKYNRLLGYTARQTTT